ncbi:bifunctional 2-C-methyl-D-erythritol 4-phosphate cytidylyltransferase/2-C-methyl-D-erythritol 2,4-cyclodiphosphate synthase [Sphingomicrobium sp. B8]|uniref:Bifunctional enzyme IspD/IspF n=2 Tax=Sphingomicrobium clamense TaxID=2851013 RepID=A0ABS6V6L2_9SPHN|nr:bifunctional 2-C-methyl-D-erythritol 4-phosphate cytidylyltransferase/2-C-methyl-D-erythritol 2,4-cyclodiphosphate synthase [Sphingomicrobium sp. B8]
MDHVVLIVAAGSGQRMGGDVPKQYRKLGGKTVLAHAVDAFGDHPVRVVVGDGQQDLATEALAERDVGDLIIGGATRSQSVRSGLASIDAGKVLIHDAARPFCPTDVSSALLSALAEKAAAVPVLRSVDTLARAHGEKLGGRVPREEIVRVQTPQAFRTDILAKAYAAWTGEEPTDEAQVVQSFGAEVALVAGSPMLDKLTTAEDFAHAEQMLAANLVSRTGMGFDVHGFAGSGPVMLGGVAIDHEKGLSGHSDADVCLHTITDALLGAAALGDIGQHFPPSDPQWKGADSETFLAHAANLVREKGGVIDHVDCTIICEAPKVGPHRDAIRANVARILELDEGGVSIKATTTEKLGFTGRREGIAAQAVATVRMPT